MKRPNRPKRTRLRANAKAPSKSRPQLSAERRAELEAKLGYRFKDGNWLTRALTHPSLIDNYDGDAQFSNQRLEFLGDRVLGLVVAEVLSQRHPKQREGYLTQLFHKLVSGETCADIGETFDLRSYIFMDSSMQRNPAGQYDKATADAVEALIAAIYYDGGLSAATKFIKDHWVFTPRETVRASEANPKTRLSDWCGANQLPYAVYAIIDQTGPAHAPHFTVEAKIEGRGSAQASGPSKQDAEKAAAAALLDKLEQND